MSSNTSCFKPSASVRRLYIGNLDPTITEFSVVKLFKVFGTITGLNFMTYRDGPLKGKSRGFCFIEYSKPEEAENALKIMNSKVILGNPIKVDWSQAAPAGPFDIKSVKPIPTKSTNPFLRKQQKLANASTEDKIIALEKKLGQLKKTGLDDTKSRGQNKDNHKEMGKPYSRKNTPKDS